ncbi:F-box/LRR-repeat protein 2 [Termitomyces sp. T112]|nr:F-box/LRR-repeat protein 2 [Termitomyces sp. T112]
MSERKLKKSRTGGLPSFGAPSELDNISNFHQDPSSSASSTRVIGPTTPPALTTICARVFVTNFLELRKNEALWHRVSQSLAALPDILIPKVFAMLQNTYPTYLSHEVIVTYFFRGPSVTLLKDLPGVKKRTILDIARFNPGVRQLELTGFDDIPDSAFAQLFRNLTHLQSLVLRGCTKVTGESMQAVAQNSKSLRILNVSFTSVTPASLAPIVRACPHLEVLKVAGIQNWTDTTLLKLLADLPDEFQLPDLRTLKLRQTSISEASLTSILKLCPALRRLDISFTLLRHPPQILDFPMPSLEKLCVTSTSILPNDLIDVIRLLPGLRALAIGAMGANRGSRASIGNTSAMTMTDAALVTLTSVLEQFQHIEDISLVGNTKLGLASKDSSAISIFIKKVGRRCKRLNLAGIHAVRSSDLAGLSDTEADIVSPLETLILNNTSIDDEASLYIATCPTLSTLAIAGTKMSNEGIFTIIDSCQKLVNLDLTSCRSIRVVDRRRFFEVWNETRGRTH